MPESPCDTPPVAEGFACEDEENPGSESTIVRWRFAAGKSCLMASVGLHGVQETAIRTNAPPNETTKETKRPDASKGGDDPLHGRSQGSAGASPTEPRSGTGRHGELEADKISRRS